MNPNCVSEVVANGEGISCLAFQLWEKAGCPEGRDLEFWLGAETYPAELELRLDAAKASEAAEADSASTLSIASPITTFRWIMARNRLLVRMPY